MTPRQKTAGGRRCPFRVRVDGNRHIGVHHLYQACNKLYLQLNNRRNQFKIHGEVSSINKRHNRAVGRLGTGCGHNAGVIQRQVLNWHLKVCQRLNVHNFKMGGTEKAKAQTRYDGASESAAG